MTNVPARGDGEKREVLLVVVFAGAAEFVEAADVREQVSGQSLVLWVQRTNARGGNQVEHVAWAGAVLRIAKCDLFPL